MSSAVAAIDAEITKRELEIEALRAARGVLAGDAPARPPRRRAPAPVEQAPAEIDIPVILKEKRCPRCETVKPVIEFRSNVTRKDGLQGFCKACHDGAIAKTLSKRAAVVDPAGHKRCGKCDKTKPIAAFAKNTAQRDGLQTQCKPCMRDSHKAWRAKKNGKEKPGIVGAGSYRCTIEDCGEIVLGRKATQHAWDEHDKRVPIEEALKFFEPQAEAEEGDA